MRHDSNDDESESIAVIVLAAGASTRMGEPKQLLPFDGSSLLRRAAETALASSCRPVIVVLGAHADAARRELGGLPVRAVENKEWAEGINSSIRAGIEALNVVGTIEAVVVTLCDQPFVTGENINELVAEYRRTSAALVVAEYDGTLGVPALFARELFGELKHLRAGGGAKRLIAEHADRARRVRLTRAAIDVDTPQDYRKLCAMTPHA